MQEDDRSSFPGPLVGGPNPEAPLSEHPMTRTRHWIQRLLAPIILGLMRGLWMTCRFTISGEEEVASLAAAEQPVIVTFWHGEMAVGAWYLRRLEGFGLKLTFVISPSRDGEFAMRVLERTGGAAVRGSATRSGVKALKGLYRAITRDGGSPVVFPDGPRGPSRRCKEGALVLSQMAQAPIVPVAIDARPAWRLRTWDRLMVPPPFSRISIVIGQAFTASKQEDGPTLEQQREHLQSVLKELGQRAHAALHSKGGD